MHGVSARSVDELVKALGMSGINNSQVSWLCAEIDERVSSFWRVEGDGQILVECVEEMARDESRAVDLTMVLPGAPKRPAARLAVIPSFSFDPSLDR